eukprot:2512795-Rhodomonas_salina.1
MEAGAMPPSRAAAVVLEEIQPVEEDHEAAAAPQQHGRMTFIHPISSVSRVNQSDSVVVEADLTFSLDGHAPAAPRPAILPEESLEAGDMSELLEEEESPNRPDRAFRDQPMLPIPLIMAQQPARAGGQNTRNRQRAMVRRPPEQSNAGSQNFLIENCWLRCATFVCPHVHTNGRRQILWRLGIRLYINACADIDPVVKFALITLSFTGAYMVFPATPPPPLPPANPEPEPRNRDYSTCKVERQSL